MELNRVNQLLKADHVRLGERESIQVNIWINRARLGAWSPHEGTLNDELNELLAQRTP